MLKIKPTHKIAIKNRTIVAKELGYNNWDEIPKGKFENACILVKNLTNKVIQDNRKLNGKPKRISYQQKPNSKVKRLNLFKK